MEEKKEEVIIKLNNAKYRVEHSITGSEEFKHWVTMYKSHEKELKDIS